MKTHAMPRSRLICRLVRGWTSLFGEATAGEFRGLGARHVATCDDCRCFFAAGDELESALKRDAARQTAVPPAGIEQRIMGAVNVSALRPRSRPTRYLPLTLACAAAGIALTVMVFQWQPQRPREVAAAHPAVAPDQVWTSLKPSAEALLSGDPLQQEVDAVVTDAQSALRFLERNFSPSQDSRG